MAFAPKYGGPLPRTLVTVEWSEQCSLYGFFWYFFQVETSSLMGAWMIDEIFTSVFYFII